MVKHHCMLQDMLTSDQQRSEVMVGQMAEVASFIQAAASCCAAAAAGESEAHLQQHP